MSDASHPDLANAIRALAMDAVQRADSGHPGMPMGMADVATVLFRDALRFDASAPDWPDRDRFVLSAGHGSMLLYSMLHLCGYEDMTLEELKRFRQLGSKTAGHPEHGHASGIETTTGPLGQGLANAVGMAIAERHLAARFGDALVDHDTYVIAGDGCLMEGISHEAISLAGHLRLHKLIVLFDDNHISIDGSTDLSVSDDQRARFEACGWHTQAVDGHDPAAIRRALEAARASDRPSLIACRTTIGFGAPTKANTADAHGSPLGHDEIAKTREALAWPHEPFAIPDPVRAAWREIGARGASRRAAWQARYEALSVSERAEWDRAMSGALPDALDEVVRATKAAWLEARPNKATRATSGAALEVLVDAVPELLGGSADLSGSNKTKTKAMKLLTKESYGGRYVHYGVREHAMAAAMNGMALHGGVIPYGGTFLVFTDYCRPAIRLSALMQQRVIYVMTHDSIGLGEDGPTHQPIEHLAALRAIPGLCVMRPADAVETLEGWELAIRRKGPTVLALTRQDLPALRLDGDPAQNRCARGAYVIRGGAKRDVTLMATGSEVAIAVEARALLAKDGIEAAVVSMPSWELFAEQSETYRAEVLGAAPRVSIEAATTFGWSRWVGERGRSVGLDHFGASAPFEALYEHFGLTASRLAREATELVRGA